MSQKLAHKLNLTLIDSDICVDLADGSRFNAKITSDLLINVNDRSNRLSFLITPLSGHSTWNRLV
jgi:hypothetical protein